MAESIDMLPFALGATPDDDILRAAADAARIQVAGFIPLGVGEEYFESLVAAISSVVNGESWESQARVVAVFVPEFTPAHLRRVLDDLGTMVGQVRKGQAPRDFLADVTPQLNLFGDPVNASVSTGSPKSHAHLRSVDDLRRVVWVWLARERVQQAQAARLPDTTALLWAARAIGVKMPFAQLLRAEPFRGSAVRLHTTLRYLYEQVQVGCAAWDQYLPDVVAEGRRLSPIELGALLAFVDLPLSNKARRSGLDLAKALEDSRYGPPRSIGEMDYPEIQRLVQQRHLLDNGPEEDTWAERALRSLRAVTNAAEALRGAARLAGHTEADVRSNPEVLVGNGPQFDVALRSVSRRLGQTVEEFTADQVTDTVRLLAARELEVVGRVEPWVLHGDPSLIVAEMESQGARERRTQWVFKTVGGYDMDATNAIVAEVRAFEELGGTPYVGETWDPPSFEEVLFWTDPEVIIKDLTRVPQDI